MIAGPDLPPTNIDSLVLRSNSASFAPLPVAHGAVQQQGRNHVVLRQSAVTLAVTVGGRFRQNGLRL